MTDLKYQSSEWVEIQNEMSQDENSKSIMDEFKTQINTREQALEVLTDIEINYKVGYKIIFNLKDVTKKYANEHLNLSIKRICDFYMNNESTREEFETELYLLGNDILYRM
tara:strand:- start:35 stop:367 length:333 start_codon:yes stop_codon:yes gene_type:complete